MQILKLDLKNNTVKLKIDDIDDLWVVYNTIEQGDRVRARTFRREKLDNQDSRPERPQKKPVFLTIQVEKVELHKYVNMVRLIGRIIDGVDVGSYHSINVREGTVFSIVRDWTRSEIGNLKEAVKDSKRPSVLVVALEEGEATFGLVRQRGIDLMGDISHNIPGKREKGSRESSRKEFFSQLVNGIQDFVESRNTEYVLIVGPELTRTGFSKYVQEKGLLDDVNLSYETCFSPGEPGIYEAIRRGAVDRLVKTSRVSQEMSWMEDLLEEIAKEGKATYGADQVENAVMAGAVDTLLITDEFFRKRRRRSERLMNKVEDYSGQHVLISTDHQGGKKLQSLGGVAAILRYQLPDTGIGS